MRVAVQTGLRRIELVEIERPAALPGTVVATVAVAGICGSDLHPYRERAEPQSLPEGHEVSAVVVEVGEGVYNVRLGDRVAIDLIRGCACGDCEYCRVGYPLHCQGDRLPFAGGFAEYVRGRAAGFFRLPDSIDDRLGALVEPLAVGVHAVRRMGVQPGATGVVLGAGTIGLCALLAARSMGSERVYITARHPFQAEAALRLGAAGALPAEPEAAVEAIKEITGGQGVDYAIEAVGGTANTVDLACRLTRPLGMVGILGAFRRGFRDVEILEPLLRELTIHLPNCYSVIDGRHDFEVAIDLAAEQPSLLRTLITHEFPLDDIAAAFATADDKRSRAIKVQVRTH